MEDEKKMILKCWERLVRLHNLKKVIQTQMDESVIVQDAYEKLKFELGGKDSHHNNRLILFMLLRLLQKPNVFETFVKALRANGHTTEADSLEGRTHKTCPFRGPDHGQDTSLRMPSVSDMAEADKTPLTINVQMSKRFLDQETSSGKCYGTRSKNRGSVLLINNMTFPDHDYRYGADVDEANLITLFKSFGFQVQIFRDLSAKEIEEEVTKFTSEPVYDSRPDVCFMIVMSHGELKDNKTVVVGHDGETIAEDELIEKFNNHNCALFENRPKILIFSVCRAPKAKDRTQTDGQQRNSPSYQGRKVSDLLVCHSTMLGETSNRDIFRGAWYIEIFCDVFMRGAFECDVETLLKRVDDRLKSRRSLIVDKQVFSMQTSSFENQGFNKTCYLHPGIYQDENGEIRQFSQ